jgi:hypothetical protein
LIKFQVRIFYELLFIFRNFYNGTETLREFFLNFF